MKKLLITILGLIIGFSITNAQNSNLGDIMDNLADQVTFGYSTTQKITVKQITNEKVTIESPLIKNEIGSDITKYTIMYSEYPLSQILEQTELLDQTIEKTFDIIPSGNTFTIELTINDNINTNKTYYVFIIPKDTNGSLGEVSNEIRFKLADQTYGEGLTTNSQTPVHNAAGADMTLANIYHTINGNVINIGRTSVDGSDTVSISLWNETTQSFDSLTTTAMSNEKFQFSTTRNGTHTVKLTPNNNGREATYTFEVTGINTTTNTPTINKVPKTGPQETAILIAITTFVIYFRYRRVQKKS